jgi:hypothetical protein
MVPLIAFLVSVGPALAGWDQTLALKACPATPYVLPRDMDAVLGAVVTIELPDSTGAGFIASPDGFVLTAAHVVEGTAPVTVSGTVGKGILAQRIRVDITHDVALLRIAGQNHPCLGPPREPPPIGAELFAIGAPGGTALSNSVSKGIVSGRREWESYRFLQTDAALSPGNSGGPLVGLDGNVLGIVSWKLSGPSVEGLSFGIPEEAASGFLGISWGPATDLTAWSVEKVYLPGEAPAVAPAARSADGVRVLESGPRVVQAPKTRKQRVRAPLITTGVGGLLVLGSWIGAEATAPMSLSSWRVAQGVNTAGWVVTCTGGLWLVAAASATPSIFPPAFSVRF